MYYYSLTIIIDDYMLSIGRYIAYIQPAQATLLTRAVCCRPAHPPSIAASKQAQARPPKPDLLQHHHQHNESGAAKPPSPESSQVTCARA